MSEGFTARFTGKSKRFISHMILKKLFIIEFIKTNIFIKSFVLGIHPRPPPPNYVTSAYRSNFK